ncbi:hypothetical protein Bpfe_013490 [Biomphalaria pfeifferi]|uniref:Uncharacterized protein n=1 Tax=Biomphalaria pfeifferi TaxID=112525 RepID=A0AAD8FB92_BIOPF|nr:hypothetical protein Bpfe_013490 [Biomphalaria pfeifferi]
MPNKPELVETKVRLLSEQSEELHRLSLHLTAEELKKMKGLADYKMFDVIIVHQGFENCTFEVIGDEEIIGDRISTCKEIIIVPKGQSDSVDFASLISEVETPGQPYDWFNQLPEDQRRRRLRYEEAGLLSCCLGNECDQCSIVFLTLGFGKGEIEISERDYRSKASPFNTATQLFCKWIERNGSNATYAFLIDHFILFEKINPGFFDWGKIKIIITNALKK